MPAPPALMGWLLDVDEPPDGRGVRMWVRRPDGSTRVTAVEFARPFYVEAPADERARLARRIADDGRAASVAPVVRRLRWDDPRPVRALAVTPRRATDRLPLARSVDAFGRYYRYRLYNVDRPLASEFYRARRLYPFAPLTGPPEAPVALEPADRIDYRPMPLRVAELSVRAGDGPREAVVPDDAPIREIRLGDERMDGPEEPLLRALAERLAREDPDLLLTDGGDGFDVPRLYARARAHGLGPDRFHLGRIPGGERPFRGARAFASYGRIYHRPAAYRAPGRFHIDRATSFLYDDVGLAGLIDAARLSRLPFETVARQSPGTVFTALEIETALDAGAAVPWKKNRPEGFRTAEHLVRADRGGVIFQPPVGIHDAVDEFDFVSLFPHLMVRHNLSADRLDCRCCPASPHVAPGLGYRFCARRPGLLPRTLRPLIARRRALRRSAGRTDRSPEARASDRARAKMLKWILVTAFGYQGYRNARFGRIEVHEAINAFARELLAEVARAADRAGYRVLHGIVDSLWLSIDPAAPTPDPERWASELGAAVDLPLGYEGRYRWIAFLPSVRTGVGVPNRFFGRYASGEYKIRGIGSRRHDTPDYLRHVEREILALFARAPDAARVLAERPRALARADLFAAELKSGGVDPHRLLIAHRFGHAPTSETPFTDAVAAARQRPDAPGVRYVVADRANASWRRRVRVLGVEPIEGPYDVGVYLGLLARTVATLLAPLGVTEAELVERWAIDPAPRAAAFASPQRPGQTTLLPPPGPVIRPGRL